MFNDRHIRESVLDYWAGLVGEEPYRFVAIPTGGLAWAKAIAERTVNPWGTPEALPQGDAPIVVVDDVVTTGISLGIIPYEFALVVVSRGQYPFPRVLSWASFHLEDR